jgi:hypothetical protein
MFGFVLSEDERPQPRLAYRLGLNLRAALGCGSGLTPMCQGVFSQVAEPCPLLGKPDIEQTSPNDWV